MRKLTFLSRNRVSILLVCVSISLLIVFAIFAAGPNIIGGIVEASTDESSDPKGLVILPSPTPPLSHTLVGSYYTLENNIDAKLLLNNKGNTPLEVHPTLYNSQGLEISIPFVTVEPQSFRFINLHDWAALGGESFRTGNIKLFHYGKDLVLGAQIYLTDEVRSLSFEEKLTELGKFNSQRQEAVWWMPSNQADARVVLTNTSDATLTVTGVLAKKPNNISQSREMTIAPHSTKAFDPRDEFPGSSAFLNSDVVALSLVHAGAADALLSRVMVYEKTKGFSNVVQFSNPAGGKSSEYQGVGFQIEDIGNQQLKPVIVARNVGNETTTVTAQVPYSRSNGTRGNIILPTENLNPGEMRPLNIQNIVQRVAQENIKTASIEVTYTTAPGTVILASHSYTDDHNQVFRVPMWDPLGQRSPTGGYPWRIEGTSVTQTYIKNITDQEESYVAFLVWESGGMYMLGLKTIAAHETVTIDVKKLRNQQIPDEKGRTIPLDISSGQLQWSLHRKDSLPEDDVRANLALMGRSEQVDLTKGVTNNYACQNCCAGTHVYGFIAPSSQEIEYGETAHYLAVEVEETCYSFPYEFSISANWTSSNSGLGSIFGGDITPTSAGQSNIGASWSSYINITYPCGPGGDPFSQSISDNSEECSANRRNKGGPSNASLEPIGIPNRPLFIPGCGECWLQAIAVIPAVASLISKTKIKKIQYQEPVSSNYIDVAGTLYVLKGTTVTFKALPDPSNSTFPAGQPTWSGNSGATGAGDTISVTFGTSSSNVSDYKSVVALGSVGGSSKTVNVVVYELTAKITPEDNYVPTPPQQARSLTDFGLKEVVGFSFTTSPSVTATQAGGLQWTVQTGTGTIPTPPRTDGFAVYTAPYLAETSTLKLEILNGPSKSSYTNYSINIVAPTNGYLVSTSNIQRTMGDFGGSFLGEFYLEPRNVSFYNLYFSEGAVSPIASQYLSYFSSFPHSASPVPAAINACIPAVGCNKVAGTDTVTTRTSPAAAAARNGYIGDVLWAIPWLYHSSQIGAGTQFTIANHHCSSNSVGTANLSKKGAGPFTIAISDPTSTY